MDNTLKHRLIGAIVLVALAVIFLPALVKGPTVEGGAEDVPLNVPEGPGEGQFQTRELPLVVAGQPNAGSSVLPAPTGQPDVLGASGAASAQAAGDYVVNFGAYDTEANAGIVVDMLGKAGLKAYPEPTTVGGRAAWRVRIGPFADRAAAETARVKASGLNSSVNAQVVVLDGSHDEAVAAGGQPAVQPASTVKPTNPTPLQANQAVTLPARTVQTEHDKPADAPRTTVTVSTKPAAVAKPEDKPSQKPVEKPVQTPAAVTKPAEKPAVAAPAAAGVGWAVQLGAFSNSEDANALRDRLRGAGFSAFVEQVPTDRGSLTRVRVGPVAGRDAAEQLKARVAASQGMSGMVVRHP